MRDPFEDNNWKIKFTHATLVSKPAGAPRLADADAAAAAGNNGGSSSSSQEPSSAMAIS